jgi:hypothetical protein
MPCGPPPGTSPDLLSGGLEADVVRRVGLRLDAEQGGVHGLGLGQIGDGMQHVLIPWVGEAVMFAPEVAVVMSMTVMLGAPWGRRFSIPDRSGQRLFCARRPAATR